MKCTFSQQYDLQTFSLIEAEVGLVAGGLEFMQEQKPEPYDDTDFPAKYVQLKWN